MNLEPLEFVVQAVARPTGVGLDCLDFTSVDEFIENMQPEEGLLVLRSALTHVKLTRGLVQACAKCYLDLKATAEETLEVMHQLVQETTNPSDDKWSNQEDDDVLDLQPTEPTVTLTKSEPAKPQPQSSPRWNFSSLVMVSEWIAQLQAVFSGATSENPSGSENKFTKKTADPPEEESNSTVKNTVESMLAFPSNAKLQFTGLLSLATASDGGADAIALLGRVDGFMDALLNAMKILAKSQKAQMAALALLGSPDLPVPPPPSSVSLILHAMQTFASSPRIQGLACLALARSTLGKTPTDDNVNPGDNSAEILKVVVAAMKGFQNDGAIQAAGCLVLSKLCASSEDAVYAALDAGCLNIVERCKDQFPDDECVQQQATLAMSSLLQKPTTSESCRVQ
ncbi:hypothetical protein Ae201684P_005029 [Aphanomyces euteiches]|nr:hypothetical protein Ae201684P_005029 [Aphanomyces euteiches]KAH9153438.1 hypothetical protein AeRB84_004317 [Aphanomyces euteiches]